MPRGRLRRVGERGDDLVGGSRHIVISDGGDYMARALARTIAATAHLSFFDSRGKLGGPRLKVKASSDEVSMRLVADSERGKSASRGAQHRA